MHYVKLTGKTIGLGRGRDSDVRVHDISVSRNHATISVTDRGVYLKDRDSKFGTLVKVQKPITISLG
jgi:pSer/pThr/pTyr-binding forkhead associated (FHA) protein